MDLKSLKAKAYELIVAREQINAQLQQLVDAIRNFKEPKVDNAKQDKVK